MKRSTKKDHLFFDEETKVFNLCYETCKTCNKAGDPSNHNCLTCDADHRFRPDKSSLNNCVTECKYYYYYNYLGQYKCTVYPQCPEEAILFIEDKNKCLDDCLKDGSYKYQYNGNCVKACPKGTINKNFICQKNDNQICTLSQNDLNIFNTLNEDNIESISKSYSEEFSYTNNSITYYQNDLYDIILFKNSTCLVDLSIKISNIDYANCFNKIKNIHKINDDELVKMIIEKHDITYKNNRDKSYLFFDPYKNEIINPSIICPNDTITINENLLSYYDENSTNFDLVNYLLDQNINIFDPNDDFYTDLCLYLETPIKKDIPIKDRLMEFYPNITLCDQGSKI